MADTKYYIHFCWNGSKRQIEWTDEYDSKREWERDIDLLPFDFLDGTDNELWVDYGDND